ncbi:hypothetical protein QTG54_016531 [Skeletonema marinoi]|uniref:Uncharacterized protein n=1 Tax=Skeletonema marinoi TaxID=267567 RepID=A0AAD8XS40_9STRA|nr:hypothetical protein QTG54_016531 [Skeletonema marinoi]|eukprot:CAMPEP_0113391130 /NCGR_PEP_ID=MMETSP0013_2-20120614/10544_1 /TAXON_ID=2843 ORGANISM="Skeletonema costatum, Strain 1716" /NCGR_SAMPLE_ID=MMETSP0013_2 /ASSEMBLY_ACC=CAM_ASM_000158 /LENGTH=279 /DNA_ID=CAMNT_0000274349 /DNA_START=107 /DNA_END=946 /DNA_ORIENTATION=+ /assembly_acc=CAM_ASM_000158
MRLFGTAALIVVALAASQCAAQSAERASIQLSRVEPQQGSLRERKLPRDKKNKHHHHHEQETQTEGTPIPPEEYYDKQTRQQQPSCSVCGDGMEVGNPDASISFPGQAGQIPCGVLQNMGLVGLIPPPQCAVLPQLISTICECESTTPPTTTVAPTTTTEATKPHSGKAGKSTQQSHSMSVPSKAGKSIHGKSTSHSVSGKSNKKTVITTKTYKSSSSKGSKMIASKASNKSKMSSKGEKSASKSSKSSGTVDAKAEKVSSSKAAKSAVPKAEKMSARA